VFGVWGRFVAEVHPATAKNCRPREEKPPIAIIHRAELCARQVFTAGARSGAWRIARLAYLRIFCTNSVRWSEGHSILATCGPRALVLVVAGTVWIHQWLVPPCESHVEMYTTDTLRLDRARRPLSLGEKFQQGCVVAMLRCCVVVNAPVLRSPPCHDFGGVKKPVPVFHELTCVETWLCFSRLAR